MMVKFLRIFGNVFMIMIEGYFNCMVKFGEIEIIFSKQESRISIFRNILSF